MGPDGDADVHLDIVFNAELPGEIKRTVSRSASGAFVFRRRQMPEVGRVLCPLVGDELQARLQTPRLAVETTLPSTIAIRGVMPRRPPTNAVVVEVRQRSCGGT